MHSSNECHLIGSRTKFRWFSSRQEAVYGFLRVQSGPLTTSKEKSTFLWTERCFSKEFWQLYILKSIRNILTLDWGRHAVGLRRLSILQRCSFTSSAGTYWRFSTSSTVKASSKSSLHLQRRNQINKMLIKDALDIICRTTMKCASNSLRTDPFSLVSKGNAWVEKFSFPRAVRWSVCFGHGMVCCWVRCFLAGLANCGAWMPLLSSSPARCPGTIRKRWSSSAADHT